MYNIVVNNIGKAYKHYNNRWSRLFEWIIPNIGQKHTLKWILKNINFNVSPGEAVGIIGINGAGKSTLLKIITGTTQSSEGHVKIAGRVAAMLELGMGFHPDFTGKQNVYMSGQLLGLTTEEITNLLPQIEEFAEIGSYINEPVRIYSSGMQVRLAFSVATALRPDVLIVDEALSVGDIYFQQKCIERIESFKKQGTAILFVTHDFGALHKICDRAVLLSEGKVAAIGQTIEVVEKYYAFLNKDKAIKKKSSRDIHKNFISIHDFVVSYNFRNKEDEEVISFISGEKVFFSVKLKDLDKYKNSHIGFRIQDRFGQVIYETNSFCQKIQFEHSRFNILKIEMNGDLAPGRYTIALGIESEGHGDGLFNQVIALTERVAHFDIIENNNVNKWAGMYNTKPILSIQKDKQ